MRIAEYQPDQVRIVRKELLPNDDDTIENPKSEDGFRAEERLLMLLRELRHPNIVRILASYTIRKPYEATGDEQLDERPNDFQYVHNLLFPLADLPLSRLLASHENHILRRHFPSDEDLYQQLWCLSSAIESLHDYFSEEHDLRLIGCHFDLAPRNILIDKGRLLLADFGLSRLRNENSRSTTPFKVGQGDYIAPECEPIENEMFTKGWYGRPSDIWSFGCILAEIVTFMIYGDYGIEQFQSMRRHQVVPRWVSTQFHVRGAASDKVREWLDKLCFNASDAQRSILSSVDKMLRIDPERRPRARDVTADLFVVGQKALWNTISTGFDALMQGHSTLELRIERERLLAWGSLWGFERALIVSDNIADKIEAMPVSQYVPEWLESSKEKLFATSDLLKSIKQELDILSTTNGKDAFLRPMGIQLRGLNERLWNTVQIPTQRRMEVLVENRILQMCSLGSKEMEKHFTNAIQSRESLGKLIAMRYVVSKMNKVNKEGQSASRHRLLRDRSSLKVVSDHSIGTHGTGQIFIEKDLSKRCLFEWVKYDTHWVEQKDDELYNRVGEIAELFNMGLPYGCQVLRCLGYFHRPETQSFGLVYPYPDAASAQLSPVTLKKSILRLGGRPMLGQIFELAYSLAYTLLIFHKVGWLHKQVSSYNVIFFDMDLPSASTRPNNTTDVRSEQIDYDLVRGQSAMSTEKLSLRQKMFSRTPKLGRLPETRKKLARESKVSMGKTHSDPDASKAFAAPESQERAQKANKDSFLTNEIEVSSQALGRMYLIGFNHSRQNTTMAFTEGPHANPGEEHYQHPQYVLHGSRQRFQLGYDYYGIGLVLLEIGLWMSLSDLIEGDIDDYTQIQQQRFWSKKAAPLLGQSMGAIYRDVVALCLDDTLLEIADPLAGFEMHVVDQLKKCHA